ncbi:FAD-binding 9, siderophore-interacting [Nocardioides sp. CF8]|uniref:siderophore-interacting protein n=1 Tax=Nocardioides sp. CF8 TaxID=110319 RepID=UPI00032F75F1|nr:siderophore-interacting protein [Nocardioides sp. CF8]EON22568.1 FAD-binding 9, siderophore-interacting [Nocardioides sp. CF8]
MTTTVSAATLPMLLTEVEVVSVERLSPSFVRIGFGGAGLAEFGVDGPRYDQRIKLVFPHPVTGAITSVADADESWLSTWLDQPTEERGHMRTYTIRDVRGSGIDTVIVVDIVLHLEGDQVGPGSSWAAGAALGDRVVMLAPRLGFPYGGIEFAPAAGDDLLMVADETAVPAVCAVLEQLPPTATGAVIVEVPTAADVLDVRRPDGVSITWLARGDAPLGQRLHDEVVAHLGISSPAVEVSPEEVDPDLWETPSYSSSGEDIAATRAVGHEFDGLYAWIAGESKVVTGLRRHLVNELHIDRSQVAFMGYWRRGVAMKS